MGVEHFCLFLLGTELDVFTDHKDLEAIFNNPKSKPPARIEHWIATSTIKFSSDLQERNSQLSGLPKSPSRNQQTENYRGRKNRR